MVANKTLLPLLASLLLVSCSAANGSTTASKAESESHEKEQKIQIHALEEKVHRLEEAMEALPSPTPVLNGKGEKIGPLISVNIINSQQLRDELVWFVMHEASGNTIGLLPRGGVLSRTVYFMDDHCQNDPFVADARLIVSDEDQFFVARSAQPEEVEPYSMSISGSCLPTTLPIVAYPAKRIDLVDTVKGPFQLGQSETGLKEVAPLPDGHGHIH